MPPNAADAARQAGYSERSARQTGCALLERPYIVERLRRIRLSWKRTEKDEAKIVLARLEQAWDAAIASGSAYLMLQVLRFQAKIAGLVRSAGANRARLWPMPEEDEFGEMEAGEAHEAGTEPGPLAEPGNADWTDDPDRQDDDWFDGMEFPPATTEHDIS